MEYQLKYQKKLKNFSRNLRKRQTHAEKILWQSIRNSQLNKCKFRRQFPIGNYILDFYCFEKRLAIELDGDYHDQLLQEKRDSERDEKMNEQGIKVLRFWDYEVQDELDIVLEKIKECL